MLKPAPAGWTPAAHRTHHRGVRAILAHLPSPLHWGGLSRRRGMLIAVLTLVIVAGAVTGTARALSGNATVTIANKAHPGDVLLVPGYGGSTTALNALAARIRASGGHAIMVQLAGDGTGDLQVQANVLNGYVNQALAAGSGPVTVIGYSAGGVVAWLWDVDYNGVAKARRIITLGSPLHGANLAAVGPPEGSGPCPARYGQPGPGQSYGDASEPISNVSSLGRHPSVNISGNTTKCLTLKAVAPSSLNTNALLLIPTGAILDV